MNLKNVEVLKQQMKEKLYRDKGTMDKNEFLMNQDLINKV